MATKNLIPRGDGEGGIGKASAAWGSAYFKTGHFDDVQVGGSGVLYDESAISIALSQVSDYDESAISITKSQISDGTTIASFDQDGSLTIEGSPNSINFSGHMIPLEHEQFDLGSAGKKIRHIFLSDNSIYLGDHHLKSEGGKLVLPSGVQFGENGATIDSDGEGRVVIGIEGLLVGSAEVKPDPNDPTSLYFAKTPQVQDSEGNPTTILTADKLGLGTSAVLDDIQDDLKFKLLTDQERFVVGTTGEGNLTSGWYRFNDFKVKGATDIGAHPINPVDTRVYSDESSFILFKTDTEGNRVAHLVGGDEAVSPNNAIALGIAVKVDEAEYPEDIEFVHTDGESYSVINGNSDSLGTNGLPVRQGFQSPSLGSNPSPLLIDGGSF
jgi:hypothetical protein